MNGIRVKMTRLDAKAGTFRLRIDWVDAESHPQTLFFDGTRDEVSAFKDEFLAKHGRGES